MYPTDSIFICTSGGEGSRAVNIQFTYLYLKYKQQKKLEHGVINKRIGP